MENTLIPVAKPRVFVPVMALAMYAVASGYFMSLIPLMLPLYGLDTSLASWLASLFYAGLLLGAVGIEPLVTKMGHKNAFVSCLALLVATIAIMPLFTSSAIWLAAGLWPVSRLPVYLLLWSPGCCTGKNLTGLNDWGCTWARCMAEHHWGNWVSV